MHHHLEIIMPPTDNVKEAIEKILAPFNEAGNPDAEDEYDRAPSKHAFWDYWVIGGRYSGSHIVAKYEPDSMDAFYKALNVNKVTVSGVQFGKQQLSPASQIPFVDGLWQEYFPDEDGPCPIFRHSNDQHKDNYADVCQLFNLPKHLKCGRIIITDKTFHPDLMLEDSYWNGVTWVDSKWDGSVSQALEILRESRENRKSEWVIDNAIESNWLLVTVDYHS